MKIKWKVDPAPTGLYRSFAHRGWPTAEFANGDNAALIRCDDDYTPKRAKGEQPHAPLTVCVYDYRGASAMKHSKWLRMVLVKKFSSLADAKKAVAAFYAANPQFMPEE